LVLAVQLFIRRWIKEGGIRAIRTLSGKYRIPGSELGRLLSGSGVADKEIRVVVYARVSSSDQRGNLEGQMQCLMQYCSAKGYRVVDVLSDVAGGVDAERRGLLKLFSYVVSQQIDVAVITV